MAILRQHMNGLTRAIHDSVVEPYNRENNPGGPATVLKYDYIRRKVDIRMVDPISGSPVNFYNVPMQSHITRGLKPASIKVGEQVWASFYDLTTPLAVANFLDTVKEDYFVRSGQQVPRTLGAMGGSAY